MRKVLLLAAALAFACSSSNDGGVTQQAATPTFNPPAGSYASAQSVTIATTTPGATLYYTTDGSTPTTSSTVYTAAVSVPASRTLKAIAVASGYTQSAVGSASYTIGSTPQAATPTFNPPGGAYSSAQSVTIATTTPGATIYYTTDGSTPTTSSSAYTAALAVATSATLKAIATAPGYTQSAIASATYTINVPLPQAATPTFNPPGGSYSSPQSVVLTTTTAGATIHYTTDGTEPTTSSAIYTSAVAVPASATLKAIAVASGYTQSAVGAASYTIGSTPQAVAPTFSPPGGTYSSAQSVVLGTTTPGATIYFTTDGSTPTTSSAAYATALAVSTSATLKAIATAPGYTQSTVASATYTINIPLPQAATPTFNPGSGSYASAQSVTIATATPGATIYYTTSGADPTTASAVYSTPVTVSASGTLKAIATAAGYTQSAIGTATYTISTSGDTTFAHFCQNSGSAFLQAMITCEKMNPDLATFIASTYLTGVFSCDATQKEIDAGRVTYDATKAAACASAITSLTCAQLQSGDLPAACQGVITGTIANGSACYGDEECANGWCNETASLCPGACNAWRQVNQGCSDDSTSCAAGLVCAGDGLTKVCQVASDVNGPCPCRDGLWCDASAGLSGTCRAPRTSGACANSGQCAIGYVCVGSPSSTCMPVVGSGGDCSAGPDLCGSGYLCDAGTSKCLSWPKVGEACNESSFLCIAGYCDSGTNKCVAYAKLGESCTVSSLPMVFCEPALECSDTTSKCVAPQVCALP